MSREFRAEAGAQRKFGDFRVPLDPFSGNQYNRQRIRKMGVFLFFLLATVCVAAVVAMIVTRNQAYSALYLVLVFAALGGLFGLLGAPFIAAVQVIIYAGAIMVLFIFVIMTGRPRSRRSRRDRKNGPPSWPRSWPQSSSRSSLLAVRWTFFEFGRTGGEPIGRPVTLGRLLFTEYLYPFEITSILIIAALVGAIVLAKKEGRRHDPGQLFLRPGLVLFALGIVAFFVRRDLITQFMAVEVMLNAANLAFLALARSAGSPTARPSSSSSSPWRPPRRRSAWPSFCLSSAAEIRQGRRHGT